MVIKCDMINKMKQTYEAPMAEVVSLASESVILKSSGEDMGSRDENW